MNVSTDTTQMSTPALPHYDYDYEFDPDYVPLEELIPVSTVYGLTMVFGLIGNSLVIASVAKFKKMRNVTNIFLLSLATADLLLVVICIPVKCAAFFSYTWRFGTALCKLVHYVQNVSILCSVMNLTVLSLERYYAILHPLRAKWISTVSLTKKVIAIIWILSLLMATPITVGRTHKPVGTGNNTGYWCTISWERPLYGQLYGVYMFVLVLFVPLCLMLVAYSSICIRVWNIHEQQRPRMLGQRQDGLHHNYNWKNVPSNSSNTINENRTRRQVIKMLFAIVVLFIICWGPITINNLLVSFTVLDDLNQGYLRPMRIAFFLLSYVNSCTNPFVYAFMSRHFRNTFKQTLFALCRKYTFMHQFRSCQLSSLEPKSNSFHIRHTLSVRSTRICSKIDESTYQHQHIEMNEISKGLNDCERKCNLEVLNGE